MSMATTQEFCTFYVEGLFLGIEVAQVQEVLRHQGMTSVPLAPKIIGGLINLRGQIVTAIDLRARLGLPERPHDELAMNVVVRCEDGVVSLLVDEIGDVVCVSDGEFEPSPDTLQGEARQLIRGVFKLKQRLLHVLCLESVVRVPAAERAAEQTEWKTGAHGAT
jgi:purine-binding chemotaxis protein CheW